MSLKTEEIQEVKSDDKKDIEMEEREKMLNVENKVQSEEKEKAVEETEEKKPKEIKEGMETKPKKIPIGGIQMPGFFTRSKSKEKCKEDPEQGDVEGAELINKDKEEETKDATTTNIKKIKIPNIFKKSKSQTEDEENKSTEPKEKKTLLETIRLPLVSVLRKKKEGNLETQTAQAGLASMETLDDKSTDDKSTVELKTVDLDDNDKKEKDVEKLEEMPEMTWRQKLYGYRIAISAILVFLLLVIIIIIIAVPGRNIPRTPPIKDGKYIETVTSCGKVEGLMEDSAFAFRGIPYARPPLGDLRFRPAQPLNNLDYCWNGTFLAHNATETCLQIYSNGTVGGVEDCLTLDVVTPYVRYENPLPVIVLIGAESLMGGSPGKMRPSARYARSKDVVFVRPNFRLGALGFLALEELTNSVYPKTSGNYGLSDIIVALKWVQHNIENFGGDPKSVTLFGHQAGATLVTALSTLNESRTAFARAWASSGGAIYPKKTRVEAEQENKSFMEAVGCKDIKCLRETDATKLVTAVEDTWRKPQPDLPLVSEEPSKRHEWLVLDGKILSEDPASIWTMEQELPIKLVLGTTAHAGASQKLLMKHTNWTEDLVIQHIRNSVLTEKNLTEEALKLYEHTYKGLSSMISDIRTLCPLFAISSQMYRVPFYVVTQPRAPQNISDIDSDIDAILGRYEPKTPEQRRYVSAMQGLFYHYVWHGRVEQQNLPGQKVLVVGQDVLPNSTYSHCAFWINKNIVLPYAALD